MKIAIIGKMGNDWGLEGIIKRALNNFNCTCQNISHLNIFDLNFFNDLNVSDWYFDMYDAVIFIQGRNIDRELLRKIKGKKVLWNAEFLPYYKFEDNEEALARLSMIEPLEDFDLILNGCPLSTKYLEETRGVKIEWFPMMGVDSGFHKKMWNKEKDIDIGFYGSANGRRIGLWNKLIKAIRDCSDRPLKVAWKNAYGEDLVKFINSCRVVLNLHYSELLNTESRIYEVLACGSFCMSEPISYPELFVDGVHFKVERERLFEEALKYATIKTKEAEMMAYDGYNYVHTRFNIQRVLNELINRVGRL